MPGDPVSIGEAAAELRRRIEARGIVVDDDPNWEARVDAQARGDWGARRSQIRSQAWSEQVPSEFAGAVLDEFEVDESNAVAAWLPQHDRNVIITGPVGVGKTRLAYALGNAALGRGLAPYAVTASDLLDVFRPGGSDKTEQWVMGADVLIVDDLGTEKATEWTAEAWHKITDHRYRNRLPIVVTTNEGSVALTEKYGNRIVSRLLANRALVIKMTGPDRRTTF